MFYLVYPCPLSPCSTLGPLTERTITFFDRKGHKSSKLNAPKSRDSPPEEGAPDISRLVMLLFLFCGGHSVSVMSAATTTCLLRSHMVKLISKTWKEGQQGCDTQQLCDEEEVDLATFFFHLTSSVLLLHLKATYTNSSTIKPSITGPKNVPIHWSRPQLCSSVLPPSASALAHLLSCDTSGKTLYSAEETTSGTSREFLRICPVVFHSHHRSMERMIKRKQAFKSSPTPPPRPAFSIPLMFLLHRHTATFKAHTRTSPSHHLLVGWMTPSLSGSLVE